MTKQELLDDLLSKDFVAVISTPELKETKQDGTNRYYLNYREQVGDIAIYQNKEFYVVNEGEETEKAMWKDSVPAQTLKEPEVVA